MSSKKRAAVPAKAPAPTPAKAATPDVLELAEDSATALKQLARHRLRAPGDARGYVLAAGLLADMGQPMDAEVLLSAGMKKAQAAPGVAGAYAAAALARGDVAEALRRAERARVLASADAQGWAVGIVAHLRCGETAEAGALLAAAPPVQDAVAALLATEAEHAAWKALNNPAPSEAEFKNRGFAAVAEKDWSGAAQIWAELREHHPDSPAGWVHGAYALSYQGKITEAEALLAEAETRLGARATWTVCAAYIAANQGNWALAHERWTKARTQDPSVQDAWVHGIVALRKLGETAAAERLREEGFAALPTNYALWAQYGYEAIDAGDWAEALLRWQKAATLAPDSQEAADRIREIQAKLAS